MPALVCSMSPESTARTREHAAAILQNLAFNSQSNREKIISEREVLVGLSDLVKGGRDKAGEYATAAIASLSRHEDGAAEVLAVKGILEALIGSAQSSNVSTRKGAISALQALSQHDKTAPVLARVGVASRAFVFALHSDDGSEMGRRCRSVSFCVCVCIHACTCMRKPLPSLTVVCIRLLFGR